MKKSFSLSNENVMINFTEKYCNTYQKVIDSEGFQRIITTYVKKINLRNNNNYKFLKSSFDSEDVDFLSKKLIDLLKLLVVFSSEEIERINSEYYKIIETKDEFLYIVEDVYGFWRKLERYSIVQHKNINEGLEYTSFIDANVDFSKLILGMYRKIEKNLTGIEPVIYRQLPAGCNAGVIVNKLYWDSPKKYEKLNDIPCITSITMDTPFITYPKKNKREGFFTETYENPIENCRINEDHWFCYPAKIGELLGYIYFHRDYMSHGVSLCNLFQLAPEEELGKKPDIVYVFGGRDDSKEAKTVFYDDKENDIMVGYVSHSDKIDYFGYMKKMILTLHNLIMIKRGYLPIHGAMVNIVMKNGESANVLIMGDSGAGKSESLEAFRALSEDYISNMTIIFDDMGKLKFDEDGRVLGYGTEIGAFVRLDDLDQGYAFKEIDRSIFMNPDKTNARLVMPVATYGEIMEGYPIDLFLYANNYEDVVDGKEEIELFSSAEEAIPVFKSGARMAKGTTNEKGLVESYFANPFGPYQKQEETNILINDYFNALFNNGIKVGQLRTCLGIEGKETSGPRNAAIKLFQMIK